MQGKKREGLGGRNPDLNVTLRPTLLPKFLLGGVPVYQVWGHLMNVAVLSHLLPVRIVNVTSAWLMDGF